MACSRTAAKVEDLAARIEAAAGGTAIGVAADVGRSEDVERLLNQAVGRFGSVQALFHNATGGAAGRRRNSPELSGDDWAEGVANHLTTPFRMAQGSRRV